jgi:PKD repeat protein
MKKLIFALLGLVLTIAIMIPIASYATEPENPPHLEVGKSVLPNPNCGMAAVNLTVTGAGEPTGGRFPVDVMLIIDRSGSMEGVKMAAAKDAAQDFIDLLDSDLDRVGLVSYSGNGGWYYGTSTLDEHLTNSFNDVKDAIDDMVAYGATCIACGLKLANDEFSLNGRADAVWVEILLTDGIPNRPSGNGRDFNEADAELSRSRADAFRDMGGTLYTIGLGNPPDISHYFLDELTASGHTYQSNDPAGHPYNQDGLAFIGGGHYYHAPTPSDLEIMFKEISEEITDIAGKGVVITEVLPAGIHYVIGSAVPDEPHEISPDGQTLKWNLGNISINSTITVTFNVTFDNAGYQLVDVYPDTRVDYTDYQLDPAFVVFPETYVTVEPCQMDYYTDWVYYCEGDSVWRTRDFHNFYCLNGTCHEDVTPQSEWYQDCPADYYTDWVYYCEGDSVYRTRDFHDYYCLNGACQEDTIPESEWYEDCPADYYTAWVYYCNGDSVWRTRDFHNFYCLNGTCHEDMTPQSEWYQDCPTDYYTDWVYYCEDDSVYRTRDFHDYYCFNGACQEDIIPESEWYQDCPADYYTAWVYYCDGDSIYRTREFHDYYCLNGICVEDVIPESELVEDCNLSDYYDAWEYYCVGDEVWMHRIFHDFSCVGGACLEVNSYYTDETFVQDCDLSDYYTNWIYYCDGDIVWRSREFHDYYCFNGACQEDVIPESEWYEDCPADYYTAWVYYCNGDSVYRTRDFHDYYCFNGACQEDIIPESEWYQDCPADYYTDWVYYCEGDSVYRTRDLHDHYCFNGTCQEDITPQNEWVQDCPADYYTDWVYYCEGDSVYRTRDLHDYYCFNGACQEDITPQNEWVQDCPADYYTDWAYYCNGDSIWRTRDFHDYYCFNGTCQEDITPQNEWVQDCPADYYTDWVYYCNGDNIWRTRDLHDYYCFNGACQEDIIPESEWYEDCLTDYYTDWVYYCEGDGVYRTRDLHDYYCFNGACQEDIIPESEWYEDCPTDYYTDWVYYCEGDGVYRIRDFHDYYCFNGTCQEDVIPESEWVQDCPMEYYDEWEFYCVDGEVWMHRMYHDYACINGTCTEIDSYYTDDQLVEDCDDGDPCTVDTCENGECVHTQIDCDDGNPCTIDFCENGECMHVDVGAPTANFSANATSGCAPLKVEFVDLSDGDGKDINSWYWDFGDGSNSTAQNPTHTYADPGIYTMSLTVSNGCGDDTKTGQITVEDCTVRPVLAIDKIDSPDPVQPGGTLTYIITVRNIGGVNATGVTVVDDYDQTVLSITDPDGGNDNGDTITWNGGITIPAGGQISYNITATVSPAATRGSTFDNTATVTCPEASPASHIESTRVATNGGGGGGAGGGAGCPRLKYLTVDWEGNNTTEPLYSNDKLAIDLLGPSPDLSHNLFLGRGTHAPTVDEFVYYLIVVRQLEDIPPVPEDTEAIVVFRITPIGAEFDRDIFLTLGLDESQLPENALNVTIAYYDDVNGIWVKLESEAGGPNGPAELTLSAPINHFSIFGVLAELAPTPPAHFVVSGLNIEPGVEKIWEPIPFVTKIGESVTITANVVNDGWQDGTFTTALKFNGQALETKSVTVGAGQSKEVSFTRSGLANGQYDVEVAGLSGEFTTSQTINWWLIIGIIVGLGLIVWGVIRTRRRHKARQAA